MNLHYQLPLQASSERSAPAQLHVGRAPPSSSSSKPHPEPRPCLGQLEAGVHADGVAQLLPQDALLAVVWELEEVETRGGGREAPARLLLADGEEAA